MAKIKPWYAEKHKKIDRKTYNRNNKLELKVLKSKYNCFVTGVPNLSKCSGNDNFKHRTYSFIDSKVYYGGDYFGEIVSENETIVTVKVNNGNIFMNDTEVEFNTKAVELLKSKK